MRILKSRSCARNCIPCPPASLLTPTYSSPADTSKVTSFFKFLSQSSSETISSPVPAPKIRVGFLILNFDVAVLNTRILSASPDVAEAGISNGAFWDWLELRAMVIRVDGMVVGGEVKFGFDTMMNAAGRNPEVCCRIYGFVRC